jgi:hypothetical protein
MKEDYWERFSKNQEHDFTNRSGDLYKTKCKK